MRPLLFVVGSATAYKIHKPFAEFCVQQGRRVQFVYDREPDALFETVSRDASAMGAGASSLDAAITPGPHKSPWSLWNRPPARARAFEALRKSSKSSRIAAFSNLIFGRLAAARALLKQANPAVVIVGEDGVAGPLVLIAAAHSHGIPVVDLPYGYGTQRDFEIALEAKAARGEIEQPTGPEGDAIREHAPEWIKRGPFEGALLFPAEYIVVLESAGISVNNAWVVHGGTADRLCAESPQMMALYRSEGLPADKLALTGTPYGDFVIDALAGDAAARARFRQPAKIHPGETRVLVSWPPSYHAERGANSEFPTYLEMTREVLRALKDVPGCHLTVSLHPAVSSYERDAIAELGVALSDHYVLTLIPSHDIFVSYFSSTIRWAIASGKPVVNYDAYKLGLDVYDRAPGVVTTPELARVKAVIADLASDDAAFATLAAHQVAVAADWGMFDRRAMPRILAEIDQTGGESH